MGVKPGSMLRMEPNKPAVSSEQPGDLFFGKSSLSINGGGPPYPPYPAGLFSNNLYQKLILVLEKPD